MKICMLGTGSLGSTIGGTLAQGGSEVYFVDQWKEHIDKINENGLKMTDEKEDWYRESKEKEVLHLHVYGSIYGHSQVPLNLFVQSLARCQIFHRFQKLKSVQNEINNLIFFVDVYLFSTK